MAQNTSPHILGAFLQEQHISKLLFKKDFIVLDRSKKNLVLKN